MKTNRRLNFIIIIIFYKYSFLLRNILLIIILKKGTVANPNLTYTDGYFIIFLQGAVCLGFVYHLKEKILYNLFIVNADQY